MTKKLLAVVVAVAVMLTACGMMAFAAETPTDVVEEIFLQLEANGAQGKMADIAADANGGVVVPQPTFENPNFNFTGWSTTADGAGDSYQPGDVIQLRETLKIYAQWIHKEANLVEFTVTYDANGGTGETLDEFGPYLEGMYVYTAYCEFEKPGAEFIGWNTEKDGSGTMYGEDEEFEISGDVVLYAIWEGGEEEEVEEETVTDSDYDFEDVNPDTGAAPIVGIAVAGVAAMGALVFIKKRD